MSPKDALKKYFGYETFRNGQEEIINTIISGNNVLAILPTGAGKSVCYQIPALISPNFSVVISPLIALMKDQVDTLNRINKTSAYINSSLDYYESLNILNEIAGKKIKLLYIAPEKLENVNFTERLKNLNPDYMFVDEAHCISEWGHNFRPSYRKIKRFIDFAGLEKISGFTATATPEVREDIIKQLDLQNPKVFVKGFERENISITVTKTKKKKEKLKSIIIKNRIPAIIYASTRKNAEEAANYLKSEKLNAEFYHAGLTSEIRQVIQEKFSEDKIDIIVATNAFGMGIDKKNIRSIVHFNMPGTIENYYQEIGRAGRDGKESEVFLLYEDNDRNIQEYFINISNPNKDYLEKVYNLLYDFASTALGNKPVGKIELNSSFFEMMNVNDIPRGIFESCLNYFERQGIVEKITDIQNGYFIRFILTTTELKKYIKRIAKEDFSLIIVLLLRKFGENIFNSKQRIDPDKLADETGINRANLINLLNSLENSGIIEFDSPSSYTRLRYLQTRSKFAYLDINFRALNENKIRAGNRLEEMIDFVNTVECRFKHILKYFGEDVSGYKCGKCDVCRGTVSSAGVDEYLQEKILQTIHEAGNKTREKNLKTILRGTSSRIPEGEYTTYGSCPHLKKEEFDEAMQQLTSNGLIMNYERFITLSDKGKSFFLFEAEEEVSKSESPITGYDLNLQLFNGLKELRKKAADKFSQNPQIICSDSVLRNITDLKPVTKEELLAIEGFNGRMFNKIGTDFLKHLQDFSSELQKNNSKELPENLSKVYELICKKYSLNDISKMTRLPEAVISMQVETILEYYPETQIESLVAPKIINKIRQVINMGFSGLKEIKSNTGNSISYAEIRIVCAKYKNG